MLDKQDMLLGLGQGPVDTANGAARERWEEEGMREGWGRVSLGGHDDLTVLTTVLWNCPGLTGGQNRNQTRTHLDRSER